MRLCGRSVSVFAAVTLFAGCGGGGGGGIGGVPSVANGEGVGGVPPVATGEGDLPASGGGAVAPTSGSGGDLPGSAFYRSANNSMHLTGPLPDGFGVDGEPRDTRPLPLLAPADRSVRLLDATLVERPGFEGWRILFSGVNVSDTIQCLGNFRQVSLRLVGGETVDLGDGAGAFLVGSSTYAYDGPAVSRDRFDYVCTAPGEAGYFLIGGIGRIDTALVEREVQASEIESIVVGELRSFARPETSVAAERVLPITYTLDPDSGRLAVTVANRSVRALAVDTVHVVYLDAAGAAVEFGVLGVDCTDGSVIREVVLAPGEERQICGRGRAFDATEWAAIRVIVNFVAPDAASRQLGGRRP